MRDRIQVVVFDTFIRTLEGNEDSAATINDYYRHTALRLKKAGISSCRLDHTGHSNKERARGSSGKNQDVDIAWSLKRDDTRVTLDHGGITRVDGVDQTLDIYLDEDRYLRTAKVYPVGTRDCVKQLDDLQVPIEMSRRKIKELYPDVKVKTQVLSASQTFRRLRENGGSGTITEGTTLGTTGNQAIEDSI
jgi:hypothetical protein